jgi:serine/threonine protein phosphatase PrpC
VFDGHGGPSCAQFCSRSVHKFMTESKTWHPGDNEDVMAAREEALKEGIRLTDKDFCQRLTSHGLTTSSGSTAIVAYIEEDTLIVANVGGNFQTYNHALILLSRLTSCVM